MAKAPDFRSLDASLGWLAKRGYLSGSLGRGEAYGRDIDVLVTDRSIADLKAGLREQGIEFSSPFMGCITWHPEDVQVETSTLFPRYKTGPKTIYGVEFRT